MNGVDAEVDGHEVNTGDQRWYTNVGRANGMENQRKEQPRREERPDAHYKYKVIWLMVIWLA